MSGCASKPATSWRMRQGCMTVTEFSVQSTGMTWAGHEALDCLRREGCGS